MLYDNYKHSASAGNLWYENQSAFLWRYGYKNWGKESPRANMGKAAEQAVYGCLDGHIDPARIEEAGTAIFDKMCDGVVQEEREAAGKIAANFIKKLDEIGGRFTRKPREAKRLPRLGKFVNLATDLISDRIGIIDLKATLRIGWGEGKDPAPHWGHVRQLGLYSHMEDNQAVSLLYATSKRVELYKIPEADAKRGATELLDAFAQIERWADLFPTPDQAMRLIPLNTDSFYWDDPDAVDAARKVWTQTPFNQAA